MEQFASCHVAMLAWWLCFCQRLIWIGTLER
jgi:hypothetical protein